MSYLREGSCNQCGKCCMRPVIGATHMMSKTSPDECKYLLKDKNLYICLITTTVFNTDVVKSPEISQEDYDYWKKACLPYPDPEDEGHTPPIHDIPKECGFRIVLKDG